MGVDPFSPLAPARVRVLVLPVGRIKKKRFGAFVQRLQLVESVRLGDISPASAPTGGPFSPQAFPEGRVSLDITPSAPVPGQSELAPFELFREPTVVIGIVDALEYAQPSREQQELVDDGSRNIFLRRAHDGFISTMENVMDQYTGTLCTQLVVVDIANDAVEPWIPEDALRLAPSTVPSGTGVEGLMCHVVGKMLREFSTHAEHVSTWSTVNTPVSAHSQAQRSDFDRRPDTWRRVSDRSTRSRDESPPPDALSRTTSRTVSKAYTSPPASIADSPRPSSPPQQDDDFPAMDTRTEAPVPSNSGSGGLWKIRNRTSAAIPDSNSGRSLFPAPGTPANLERERNVGRARVGLVLGSMHLMAGRWPDAWRHLIENTAKARSLNDNIWLAAGIERIVVCMLLLGSHGFAFQIPSVCLLNAERFGSLPFLDNSKDVPPPVGVHDSEAAAAALAKLGAAMNDIALNVVSSYDRAGTLAGEHLPQLAYSEMMLRICRLQTSAAGLTRPASALRDTTPLFKLLSSNGTEAPNVSKSAVSELLFRAYPGPFADIHATSRTMLLGGIASVLADLGLERKRAMVLKELMMLVVPAMQQARRAGAAELGIHPSSSLSYLSATMPAGDHGKNAPTTTRMIQNLQSAYALKGITCPDRQSADDYEALVVKIVESMTCDAGLGNFGALHLKFDILRYCIEFCDSIPDLLGVAANAALLLRLAGPRTAVNPKSERQKVRIAAEEQVRLANHILSATRTAKDAGIVDAEPLYWDDFLVRDVQIITDEGTGVLLEKSKSQLSAAKQGPFLHDAFDRKQQKEQDKVVAASEPTTFALILQNPFDLEMEIERISLITNQSRFPLELLGHALGPSRMQEISGRAAFDTPGDLTILGCHVKMAGCREQFFPIFQDEWKATPPSRDKSCIPLKHASPDVTGLDPPRPSQVSFQVIDSQPLLVVESISTRDQSTMLMDGESAAFGLVLRNLSSSTSVGFIHSNYEDGLTRALQSSLAAKNLSRSDVHEIEINTREHPVFICERKGSDRSQMVLPLSTIEYDVTILGRMGAKDATISFEYGNDAMLETAERIFCRRLSIPISTTVYPTVQIQHFEVARLTNRFTENEFKPGEADSSGTREEQSRQCLMVLDLRNAWTQSLEIELRFLPDFYPGASSAKEESTISRLILSGETCRVALPVSSLHVQRALAQIPWLSASARRQFVVSSAGPPEQELSNRRLFWYREELLKRVSGSWRNPTNGQRGLINLRAMALSERSLEALALGDVDITFGIRATEGSVTSGVAWLGRCGYSVEAGQPLTLVTTITNRSDRAIRPMLRLQPALCNQAQDTALASAIRNFIWSGLLQRPLDAVGPGERQQVELGFCVLSPGMYEIGALVEELQPAKGLTTKHGRHGRAHDRHDDDDDDLDDVGGAGHGQRRVWKAMEPCLLSVGGV